MNGRQAQQPSKVTRQAHKALQRSHAYGREPAPPHHQLHLNHRQVLQVLFNLVLLVQEVSHFTIILTPK